MNSVGFYPMEWDDQDLLRNELRALALYSPFVNQEFLLEEKSLMLPLVCAVRAQKSATHRVHMTFGGDKLDYWGDPSSPATSMLTTKIYLNSTISDAKRGGARYFNMDVKDFFLGSPINQYQYARVHASLYPWWIFTEYPNLVPEADGFVYFEARKGIYGLKEAVLHLVLTLNSFGYEPVKYTPGLWRHCSQPTTFTLCVDDCGVNYFSIEDADHVIHAIKSNYDTTIVWGPTPFIVVLI